MEMKKINRMWDLSDDNKRSNPLITRVPEEKGKECGAEKAFKEITI
jgi:hypothetical protein